MRDQPITKKRKSNGVSKTMQTPPPEPKLAQPMELSDQDRAKLRDYLNSNDKPFTVTIHPLTKKRKRTNQPVQTQTDLWEDRLAVQYDIDPQNNWDSLRRYKKFTVGSESIACGECILVKHDETEEAKIDIPAQWKAKVLEVRALDQEHVYVRVAWLNRPEDLTSGRKPYHGKNELIPTNSVDIIDAMTVNGRLDVLHWDEKDDESAMMPDDQYFWRQTYDELTKSFSDLRKMCIDKVPQNPDEMILQCSHADCRKWMHVKCIAEDAVLKASAKSLGHSSPVSKKRGRAKSLAISPSSTAQAMAQKDAFISEVHIKDLPAFAGGVSAALKTEVIIIDGDGMRDNQDVRCLFCQHPVD